MIGVVIPGYYYAFEIIIRYSENSVSHRYNTNTLYYCLRDEKKNDPQDPFDDDFSFSTLSLTLSLSDFTYLRFSFNKKKVDLLKSQINFL